MIDTSSFPEFESFRHAQHQSYQRGIAITLFPSVAICWPTFCETTQTPSHHLCS
jgi:hypothetical protein